MAKLMSRMALSALLLPGPATHAYSWGPHDPGQPGSGALLLSTQNLSVRGGVLFEATFDADTLSGDLVARQVNEHGKIVAAGHPRPPDPGEATRPPGGETGARAAGEIWRAGAAVTGQSRRDGAGADNRVIFTSGIGVDGVRRGFRFRWRDDAGDALTAAMKAAVNELTPVSADSDPVLDWTRGHDTNEGAGAGDLRQRHSVLGNLMHGDLLYLGPPDDFYRYPGHEAFRLSKRDRPPLVFAGGSDGMLHAFRVDTGQELFAFVPADNLRRLKARVRQDYDDTPLVGGPLAAGDVYGNFARCADSPCWRTVLVGGLGAGGRSVFALDVSDPLLDIGELDPESGAADQLLLWEFHHDQLGLTTSRPLLARLGDGNWVAVFGSGTGSGKAVLFVLDAATGELLHTVEAPSTSGANGLSSPAGWDRDHDGDIDSVYAGDLEGNLWKFDFPEASGSAEESPAPGIAFAGDSLVTVAAAAANGSRAIRSRPLLSLAPGNRLMVFFATHGTAAASASVYGVFDDGSTHGTEPGLVVHDLALGTRSPSAVVSDPYRILELDSKADDAVGWQVRLPAGEQLVGALTLVSGRVGFTSVSADGPAAFASWLVGVDYATGSAPDEPFLDMNSDGVLDEYDRPAPIDAGTYPTKGPVPVGKYLGPGWVTGTTRAVVTGDMDALFYVLDTRTLAQSGSSDPGVPGGGFDQNSFDWSPAQFGGCAALGGGAACESSASCWGAAGWCHAAAYDDTWHVDGVNMLRDGGGVARPPDVESATGILDDRLQALQQAIRDEESGSSGTGMRAYSASVDDEVELRVRNPNSVDRLELADRRAASANAGDPRTAPPATIYFNCDRTGDGTGDHRVVLDAPGFNLLPAYERACVIGSITELRVRHHSIHALRATNPDCVALNDTSAPPESLGDSAASHPNTGYRNGAFTVQAITTGNRVSLKAGAGTVASAMQPGIVVWESVSYHHYGEGCSSFNEAARSDNAGPADPGGGPGEGGAGGGGAEGEPAGTESGSETTIVDSVNVSRSLPPEGRVSWREIRQ